MYIEKPDSMCKPLLARSSTAYLYQAQVIFPLAKRTQNQWLRTQRTSGGGNIIAVRRMYLGIPYLQGKAQMSDHQRVA
jgi:hypothetical protein